jgi:hypothetical protein
MSDELWLALGAAFGPVLREAFPKASSRERMQVGEALVAEVRKRESWLALAAARRTLESVDEIVAHYKQGTGQDVADCCNETACGIESEIAALSAALSLTIDGGRNG